MLHLFVNTAPEEVGADEGEPGAANWRFMLQQSLHSMLLLFVYTASEEVGAGEEEPGAAGWQFLLQQMDIPCCVHLCTQLQKRSEQMEKSLEQQQIGNLCYSRGTFHVIFICVHSSRRRWSR